MSKIVKRSNTGKRKYPEPRAGHGLVALNEGETCTVFVVGGYNPSGALNDVWSLNPCTSEWNKLFPLSSFRVYDSPLPRYEFSVCGSGRSLYLFGGMTIVDEEVSIYNDLWKYDIDAAKWNLILEECPVSERCGHIIEGVQDGAFIVIHGGECNQKQFGDLWVYHIETNSWLNIVQDGPSPSPRCGHSSTVCGGTNLVIVGGLYREDDGFGQIVPEYLNEIWVLNCSGDPGGWRWRPVVCTDIAPSPRDLPGLCCVGDHSIIIYGGFGLIENTSIGECESDGHCSVEKEEAFLFDDRDKALNHDIDLEITGAECNEENRDCEGIENNQILPRNLTLVDQSIEASSPAADQVKLPCDEEIEVAETVSAEYLNDLWMIDLVSGHCVEIESSNDAIACRGPILYLHGEAVHSFGGYDGDEDRALGSSTILNVSSFTFMQPITK